MEIGKCGRYIVCLPYISICTSFSRLSYHCYSCERINDLRCLLVLDVFNFNDGLIRWISLPILNNVADIKLSHH